jgi:hypothetical protein
MDWCYNHSIIKEVKDVDRFNHVLYLGRFFNSWGSCGLSQCEKFSFTGTSERANGA